jgi:hypothetical protein
LRILKSRLLLFMKNEVGRDSFTINLLKEFGLGADRKIGRIPRA